ncbi:hypothetical protein Fmac_031439 [Flemingia macrophylla]|uniref:Zinc-ribbon domain-containing protein n=1 Tax=Flemingia macrophylla TaxID=520843 RepID=A0ABD1L231_9FABA
MPSESAPKPRLVLCPKCWQLLPESPNYDVYKCGGCGTTLQAKKRRSKAVNSESSTREIDAAARNALDPKANDAQYSNGEQLDSYRDNGMRKMLISSSSGECSLDETDTKKLLENGECNGEQLVASQETGFKERAISSSSGACALNGNGGRGHNEDAECNGEQLVTSSENVFREKTASSSLGECSLNRNGGGDQIEEEHPVISQENGLREKVTNSSSGECYLNGNAGRDQIENGECIGEKLVASQVNGLREKGTSSSSGECSLDGGDQVGNGDCNGEQIGEFNLLDKELENEMDVHKLSNTKRHTMSNYGHSDEPTHFEIEASSELMAERSVENGKNTILQLEGEVLSNGNKPLEGAVERLISALDKEDANDEKSAPVQVKSEVDIAGNVTEVVEEINNENLLLEGAKQELFSRSDREVNIDKPSPVGAKPEVEINEKALNNGNLLLEVTEEVLNGCASDGEYPKLVQSDLVVTKSEVDNTRNASTAKWSSSEEENISCAYPCELEQGTSSKNESSKTIHHSFNCVRSVDTFDNTQAINPGFGASGTLGGLSKASTTHIYHAYDGSISSNDGVDEQFPNQYLDSFESTYTVANGVSEGGSKKGKGLVNSSFLGDLETQHQSYFPEREPHVPKYSRRNQNEVPDAARHGHAHWMRTKRDEFPPRIPHGRSGSQSGYESGSTSNQMQDEFYCSSSYLSPDSFDDPDQEKMKLLRMVYKLQERLHRASYTSGETNGRLTMGSHISAYQNRDLHERKFYHGLDYPRCDGICSHGINCCQTHNFSPLPYLAEPTNSAHHVDHSRFPCCPQQWQCSAELPPRVHYQHNELHRPSPGQNCCSAHHSFPSSPQWFTSNFLAHGRETKSCDQMHGPEVKKYLREKPTLTRRHYRPVAGGAPFVTCYTCFKLLQLPADFLLFKRVCHQLKCGACQEVLKFSLQNRSHIVSYATNAQETPSSYLDNRNEVISDSNPHSSFHANDYQSPQRDHISYSDDCGHSVGKSYSSEGDHVSVTPLHPFHGSAYDNPTVSSGTLEPITEKEKTASRGPSTSSSKAPVETDELAVNSSNLSSEMEAHALPKSSPLHQLMGYSSPRQVITGIP